MYYNIIKLAKWAHYSESLFLLNLFLLTLLLSTYIIPFIRLNSLKFKSIFKEEGLDGKINSMPLAADTLLNRIPGNILIISKILINCTTEGIIYCRIIRNNSSKLLYNPILLQDQEKSILLFSSTVTRYYTKGKKSFYPVFLAINKVGADCKKKAVIWGRLDINRKMNTYQR